LLRASRSLPAALALQRRLFRAATTAVLIVATISGAALSALSDPLGLREIDLRGDFETGDISQFTHLECPNPSRQLKILNSPVRQGRYAARFETAPGDNWSNGVRCKVVRYDSNESEGDEYYYGMSMYFPKSIDYTHMWELHQRADIYNLGGIVALSPHAIMARGGRLEYRMMTGAATWNGNGWNGWSNYLDRMPLTTSMPTNQWVDFIVHLKFTESNTGLLEVWVRTGNEAWATTPQLRRTNIPTLQYVPGGRDPDVRSTIHTSSLYAQMGLYKGSGSTSTTDVVYHDGYRRGTSLAAVQADFP
jgi:hypothetical protein